MGILNIAASEALQLQLKEQKFGLLWFLICTRKNFVEVRHAAAPVSSDGFI